MAASASRLYLQTLGSPVLLAEGTAVHGLRRKDLALLVYICLAGKRTYSRAYLANLLWGDRDEHLGRHSLTQTLRRLQRTLVDPMFRLERNWLEWEGGIACDALQLEEAVRGGTNWSSDLYLRDFLMDFDAGSGADTFEQWADERRARYRTMMVQVVDRMGAEAERNRQWSDALELAQRVVEFEPIFEEGHRRMMRAWSALGARALALQHYYRLTDWLRDEYNEPPDPATRELADALRAGSARELDADRETRLRSDEQRRSAEIARKSKDDEGFRLGRTDRQ